MLFFLFNLRSTLNKASNNGDGLDDFEEIQENALEQAIQTK